MDISTATTSMFTSTGGDDGNPPLVAVDYVVIGLYLGFILIVGIIVMCKSNRSDVGGFFLAGRNVNWLPIGASLFSSNIGSVSFLGLASSGAAGGIAVGAFEWNAMLCLFFLGWLFAPVYIASGVVTMPEYLRKRFGGERIQIYMSVLSLLLYIFTKISADLFSGAIFIQEALNWNIYLAIIVLLVITALYTVTGGLTAVIYTDAVQTFIMLAGGFVMMILSFNWVGGYAGLEEKYPQSIPEKHNVSTGCGIPRSDAFHVFRDPVTSDLPWPGLTFGLTIIATWYWCTDQVLAQRTLAAKNLTHAKAGCVIAGLMKILPMYMMVMVGMISRIYFPDYVGCAFPEECKAACGVATGCSNNAYPKLMLELMPTGLKGLLLACMLAALMSSLTSVFNSGSTLFTCDLWAKYRRDASEWELMIVGRVFILVLVGISIAWVPIIQSFSSGLLFDYIQSITSYLGPPIMVVFAMAVFWPRLNEPGAFWSLMAGLVTGLTRMIMDFAYGSPLCGQEEFRPAILYKVHYLHFAILLAGVTTIVAVVVSLITPPISRDKLRGLTWFTRFLKRKPEHELAGIDNEGAETKDEEKKDVEAFDNDVTTINSDDLPSQSWFKKAFLLFCGLDEKQKHSKASEVPVHLTNIREETIPSLIVDLSCLIMLCTMVFLFAYYG